jgi:hypothetical protein
MTQKFNNDARAMLATSISDSDTSIVLSGGSGDLFPVADMGTGSTGDWFKVTLENALSQKEIVRVRTRTMGSDILADVERAQESTVARAFDAGTTVVGLRLTAGDIEGSFAAALNAFQPGLGVVSCSNFGPVSGADKSRIHKSSPLGEYWAWLGDSWRVVSRHAGSFQTGTGVVLPAYTASEVFAFTCHRAGLVSLHAHSNANSTDVEQHLYTIIKFNGVDSAVQGGYAQAAGITMFASATHMLRVEQADSFTVDVMTSRAGTSINWGVGLSYLD